jgi:DNA-binding Xre family transcriptional regulator
MIERYVDGRTSAAPLRDLGRGSIWSQPLFTFRGTFRRVAGGAKPPPGPLSRRLAGELRRCFEGSNVPVTELADLVGVSRRQMTRYLAAERVLDVEQLAAICEVLACDPADLLLRALRP